jgi:ligand-binding sensor domain-containing protein
MKKWFLSFILALLQIGFAQQNQNWKGFFSYNKIKDLSESNNQIFAASENALFAKNLATGNLKTTNTVDGLSGETISAIYHSDTFNKTIVGYENGLLIVSNDADGSMLKVVDIINKNIPPNIKKINHITEFNNILYISCDFGIVQYKLATLEFGDTYYIGPSGEQIKVYQTTILNNEIYAATQYEGIRKADINNANLNDFTQWQLFDGNYWNGLVTFNNQLIGLNANGRVYKYNGSFFNEILNIGELGLDIRSTTNYLTVASQNHVYILNQTLNQAAHIQANQITTIPVTFSCATTIDQTIFIGTNENGIVSAPINAPTSLEFLMPSGPLRNNIFAVNALSTNLWAVFGGYDTYYNPYAFYGGSPPAFGISKYNTTEGWQSIPYSQVLGARALCKITVNPKDENQVYISSFHSGLLKVVNAIPTILYDQTNSGLETLTFDGPNISVRINGTVFDKTGNLWITNSRIKNELKVLKNGTQWQSYNLENILSNSNDSSLNNIVIDNSGTKWIASNYDGVVAFNENTNVFKKITEGPDAGNLPTRDVRVVAVDNKNQLWIGTAKGLRVLSNTSSYNGADQMKANAIIILEDGLAQELLYEQFITDIVVNGSNQKWIATADSGVFLFSPDGQKTIYHFTKDNSPLPSNVVNDIDINPLTGEIFFATDKGMVSFQGTATRPSESLADAYVYPNPVRPEFTGTVKIAGLISKANVKVTDIEGNLVFETTSEGGTVEWDTTAFNTYKVASGVYMIFIAAADGSDTVVKKVMIIR